MQTVSTLARQEATPRQRGAGIDDLFCSRLVVNPISDLRLVVIVAFAVVGYGEVGIVGHHLGIDNACRTRVFVEHDVRPADACAGRDGSFDQTIPALPFCVSYYELHDQAARPGAHLEDVSK